LVCDIIEKWAYLHVPVTPSKEVNDFKRSFAISMIKDILLIANNNIGVLRWADEIASNLQTNINVHLNSEFNILYPREGLKNWKQESINQAGAVRELAKKWLNEDVDEIVKRIGTIENESQMMKITYPRWTPFLCSEIAKESTQPCRWIRAMMDNRMPCDLIEPFLKNAAIKNDIEWIDLAVECLKEPLFRYAAISVALTQNNCDEQLLESTLQSLEGFSSLIETLCVRNQIDEYKIKKLLRHHDTSIAIATAEGIWRADPEETITESLKQEWRNVIVNATKGTYWLYKTFEQDNSLAYEWIRNYLNNDKYICFDHINKNILLSAIKILDDNQKREILNNTPIKYGIEQFIFCLIGDDLELYSFLLKKKELSKVHLVPLSGYPGECIWLQKAKIALDSGY
jgi:hypothetical protein